MPANLTTNQKGKQMSDQEVVEYQLDTITKATRFVASAPPKVATRVALGVTLAVDDAANDPAGALLGAKLSQGATALVSSVRHIATASAGAVSERVDKASTPEAKAARAAAVNRIPGFGAAKSFVVTAASEAKSAWDEAGSVPVQIVAENSADAEELPEYEIADRPMPVAEEGPTV